MTRARSTVIAILASLAFAAAGWASRAELDEVIIDGVRQRIALVPSWHPFVAFLALAALAGIGGAVLVARGRRTSPETSRVGTLWLPVFGLSLLVVPYLPVAPDWWPALQALAGPGRWVVWALVGTQLVWVLWPALTPQLGWVTRRSLRTHTVVIWVAAAAAAGVGASRLTHTVLFPSGDEPHYLVLAQSMWRDGDLRIENNHTRGDYKEYFGRDLEPHYLTRGADREIYSVHPVGMPALVAPVLALGGYDLVVAFFIAMAATAATVTWRWAVATTGAPGPTTLAWAAIVFSAPFLINAFTIYPEVPAALVVALAVVLTLRPTPDRRPWHDVAVSGLAATLPWLSTKYAPMSAAILVVAAGRVWWPMHAAERSDRSVGSLVRLAVPYGLSLAGWFAFFYAYWGRLSPSAPYGRMNQTQISNALFGLPGLLFDQEYGLLAYAPAYVLAGFGLWTMVRRPGALRRLGLEVTLIVAALAVTVGAFRIWWGGSAAPGRPLTSGLLLLMLPMAVQIGSAKAAPARRAAQHVLTWVGVAMCVVLLWAQEGLLVANSRDGTSVLLEWFSPRWPLWQLAPTFIAHEAPRALIDVAVWLVAVATGSWALGRIRTTSRGGASLAALTATLVVLVLGSTGMRALPAHPIALPGVDLGARARLAALDSFDQVTRPLALRYSPLRLSGVYDVEPMLALGVAAGQRREAQPVRVLHNGRFSLPAGRYRAVVRWAAQDPLPAGAAATIGLQVGRIGNPMQTWTVAPTPGGRWQQEFVLPVDIGFVGLQGASEVERSIDSLRIEPLDIEDAGTRTPTPQVLSSAVYGALTVLFHDGLMYPEARGFWTSGERPARVTIACTSGCARGVTLFVHSGKRPNQLRVATHGWSHAVDLRGDDLVAVHVPPPALGDVIVLDTTTTTGFVPMDIDPSVRDRRYLGAWIEPRLPVEDPR